MKMKALCGAVAALVHLQASNASAGKRRQHVAAAAIGATLKILSQLVVCAASIGREVGNPIWDWWKVVALHLPSHQFAKHFRVTRERFDEMTTKYALHCRHEAIGPLPEHEVLKSAKQIAATLWRLATGECLRSISSRFGVSESTVVRYYRGVVRWLACHCSGSAIVIPQSDSPATQATMQFFRQKSEIMPHMINGFPRVRGAIDCTHIILQRAPPCRDPASFIDRKGEHSVQMQAVVDHNAVFLDVFVGFPGSVHDNRVLLNSGLHARAGEIFSDGSYLLADAGYAPLPWIVPALRIAGLEPHEEHWNYVHSSCRMVVERGFGILKGRWRILTNAAFMDVDTTTVCETALACCVLHNYCMADNKRTYSDVHIEREEEEVDLEPPEAGSDTARGRMMRTALMLHMHEPF